IESEGLGDWSPERTGEISRIRLHPADLGTDAQGRDLDARLAKRQIRELQEIEEALERMRNGKYGICERCGRSIAFDRLKVLPESRYCVLCEKRLESQGKRPRVIEPDENLDFGDSIL